MNTIDKYILLITQFVIGEITASQFEDRYLEIFKNESNQLPEHVYNILNKLFSNVDSYCDDPNLRDEEDLDDEALLVCAKEALENLKRRVF